MADKSLKDILGEITKAYGDNSIMLLGEDFKPANIEVISTGSIKIDEALGVGGLPKGRIIEIYGPESSGKTTFCLHVIAEAQKIPNKHCAIIDAEHALDMVYAEKLGIDVKKLVLSQPDNGEQALNVCEMLIKSGMFSVIVVDSVAALTPQAEIEGEMGDSVMGMQARLMSQALRKLVALVANSGTILIFTNQTRDKIGVMFGSPETTTGGKALKFYASIRMTIRRIGPIKEGTEIIGNQTKLKVIKNKVAPPYKEVDVEIIYNEGISKLNEIISLAVEKELIKKSGAWYVYDDKKVQGINGMKAWLKEQPQIVEKLRDLIVN